MRVILIAGTTKTAAIDGISAAGATSRLLMHTPSADAEIISYGLPIQAPVTPVSPSGCPTPAVITRAIRERIGFDLTVVDAGLAVQLVRRQSLSVPILVAIFVSKICADCPRSLYESTGIRAITAR
jgi:NaMN:DMB phosphoribosyltransferase